MDQPTLPLSNGLRIPQLGFGTYGLGRHATEAILHALSTGYRHIDTADIYGSHANVAEAIEQSGLRRDEIFITTKLWSNSVSSQRVAPEVDRFLKELRTDYIDLLLIHWPSNTPVAETLTAMDQARQAGKVRSIGVSNFDSDLVQASLDTGVYIVNDQIEFNLNHRPHATLKFCLNHNVTVTAYSPLEHGTDGQEHAVATLAKKHKAAREEVLLNWIMGKGMIAIPRSSNPKHITANFHALTWKLDIEDAQSIDQAK